MVKTFILQSLWPYFVIVVGAFDAYDETVGYNTSTVAVIRRISNDVYYQATCHCHTWCDDNTTYLVAEEQCVDNSNFYNGKT